MTAEIWTARLVQIADSSADTDCSASASLLQNVVWGMPTSLTSLMTCLLLCLRHVRPVQLCVTEVCDKWRLMCGWRWWCGDASSSSFSLKAHWPAVMCSAVGLTTETFDYSYAVLCWPAWWCQVCASTGCSWFNQMLVSFVICCSHAPAVTGWCPLLDIYPRMQQSLCSSEASFITNFTSSHFTKFLLLFIYWPNSHRSATIQTGASTETLKDSTDIINTSQKYNITIQHSMYRNFLMSVDFTQLETFQCTKVSIGRKTMPRANNSFSKEVLSTTSTVIYIDFVLVTYLLM